MRLIRIHVLFLGVAVIGLVATACMFDLPDDNFVDIEMGKLEIGVAREAYIDDANADETERHLYDFEVQTEQTVRISVEPSSDFSPFVTIRSSRDTTTPLAQASGDLQVGEGYPVEIEATLSGGQIYVIGVTSPDGSGEYRIEVEIVSPKP